MTTDDDATTAAAGLDPGQVRGARYLGRVFPLLARLRPDGCARDRAGNRTLFYDQYACLVLLSMFSPAIGLAPRDPTGVGGWPRSASCSGATGTRSGPCPRPRARVRPRAARRRRGRAGRGAPAARG